MCNGFSGIVFIFVIPDNFSGSQLCMLSDRHRHRFSRALVFYVKDHGTALKFVWAEFIMRIGMPVVKVKERNDTMNKNPIVTINMNNGDVIRAELYPQKAPNTVNNFISLVKKGFYDGLIFHRVINGFMIQGGDPQGNGTGGPGYSIKGEFSYNGFSNDLKHTSGVLSMARAMDPDSAGSQFFIMHKDAPHLDGQYAAFGRVTEGMDVVDKIARSETDYNDRPLEDQIIQSMTVETFGADYPEPVKC